MLRRFTVFLTGMAIVLTGVIPARAETYVPPLAFNAVSAVAKEKDLQKGLQTALKEQNVEWFWELGGGIEKAMMANNEAEFTDALNEKVATIQTVYALGMQYAEGNYSGMALTVADEAVNALNNPAASAVWEMIKVTHQSYKAVADTKAALDIEMLYSAVNADRRLIGKSTGGAPPTINVNSETVDYFFNKYLITDGSVRAMVKSYVEKSLGQTWPEQSWKDYMIGMTAGASEATKAESELRQLQSEEFKNVARGWIRLLLVDVNKQVTLEYYRMRVRQEMAEYAKYAEKVGSYYESGYPVMWKILRAKKAAKENIPVYKEHVKAAKEAVQQAQKAHQAAKAERQKKKVYEEWNPRLNGLNSMLTSDAASAYLLDDTSMYDSIQKMISDVAKVRNLIIDDIKVVYDGEPEPLPYSHVYFGLDVMLAQYFTPLIVVEDLDSYDSNVKSVIKEGVRLLNKGDFDGASALWDKKLGNTKESVWYPVYKKMDEVRTKIYEMCDQDPLDMSDPNLRAKADAAVSYRESERGKGYDAKSRKQVYQETLDGFVGGWKQACEIAKNNLNEAQKITQGNISEKNAESTEVYMAYDGMSKIAHDKYNQTKNLIGRIRDMTNSTEALKNRETQGASLYKAEEEAENGGWCPGLPKSEDDGLLNIGGGFMNNALRLGGVGSGEPYFKELTSIVNEDIKNHEAAHELWKSRPRLTTEDMQMIGVFVKGAGDFGETVKEAEEHVSYIPSYVSAQRTDLNKYLAKARPAYNECTDEKERQIALGEAFKKWQKGVIDSGLAKPDRGKLVNAKLRVDETGMVKVDKPYRHYLTANEIKVKAGEYARQGLSGALRSYLASKFPVSYKEYQELMELKGVKPARTENIILRHVVYLDDVEDMRIRFENVKWTDGSSGELMNGKAEKFMDEAATAFPDIVQKQAATYLIFIPQPNGIEAELESKTGKAYVELAKTIKRRWTDHNNAISAAMLVEQEVGRKAREKEQEEMFGSSEPIDASGYWIVDARLNYKSYPVSGSRTILTNNNLMGGKIYFSGRINTLENVEKVLFSLDGGRSWEERPLAPNVMVMVTPTPNKDYKPVVKLVRSEGFDPVVLSFSDDTTVSFSNMNYTNKIVAAVKRISEAYEGQNLSLFSDLIADNFVGGRIALEEGVRFDFEMFTNIQLKLYINRITETSNGKFVVNTKWDKTQIPRSTGVLQKTGGQTVIALVREGEDLKIQNLRGALLYATLSPDIAAASGLSNAVVDEITTARDTRTPSQPGAGTSTSSTASGGSSTTATISITTVTRSYVDDYYYDFDTATESSPGATAAMDIRFENHYGPAVDWSTATFVDMSGSNTFANLNTAPDAGYTNLNTDPGAGAGKVYAFKTTTGHYGKFEIISSTDVSGGAGTNEVSFRYAVQPDGSKNIATQ